MKRIFIFFKSIIPSRKKFNSWAMPTKIGYLSFIFFVLTYFVDNIFKWSISNSEPVPITTKSNQNDKIIVFESQDKINENFDFIFEGRLKNMGIEDLGIVEADLKRNIQISIDYTGFIKQLNNESDVSNYSGGHLVIKIESCILSFNELSVPPMGPAPKSILINLIEERFIEIFQKNKNNINKSIKICLKDLL